MNLIFKNFAAYFLGKTFGQSFFKFLHLISLKGMNFGGGVNPKDSGEEFAVEYALNHILGHKPMVFDVGGNKGDYTRLWLLKNKNASVHIFEPSAFLNEQLKKTFENTSVKIHKLALGAAEGESSLFSDRQGSGLGSLLKRNISHAGIEMLEQEKVKVQSLDAFCQSGDIESVDFLKLDVEGFELEVLKGAKKMLENKKIKFIQFEFGGTDIDARVFFKDFYMLLSPNYKIFRVLKNGLFPIKQYSELDEIFLTTNYLAELKDIF